MEEERLEKVWGQLRDSNIIDSNKTTFKKFKTWMGNKPDERSSKIYNTLQQNQLINPGKTNEDKFKAWLKIEPIEQNVNQFKNTVDSLWEPTRQRLEQKNDSIQKSFDPPSMFDMSSYTRIGAAEKPKANIGGVENKQDFIEQGLVNGYYKDLEGNKHPFPTINDITEAQFAKAYYGQTDYDIVDEDNQLNTDFIKDAIDANTVKDGRVINFRQGTYADVDEDKEGKIDVFSLYDDLTKGEEYLSEITWDNKFGWLRDISNMGERTASKPENRVYMTRDEILEADKIPSLNDNQLSALKQGLLSDKMDNFYTEKKMSAKYVNLLKKRRNKFLEDNEETLVDSYNRIAQQNGLETDDDIMGKYKSALFNYTAKGQVSQEQQQLINLMEQAGKNIKQFDEEIYKAQRKINKENNNISNLKNKYPETANVLEFEQTIQDAYDAHREGMGGFKKTLSWLFNIAPNVINTMGSSISGADDNFQSYFMNDGFAKGRVINKAHTPSTWMPRAHSRNKGRPVEAVVPVKFEGEDYHLVLDQNNNISTVTHADTENYAYNILGNSKKYDKFLNKATSENYDIVNDSVKNRVWGSYANKIDRGVTDFLAQMALSNAAGRIIGGFAASGPVARAAAGKSSIIPNAITERVLTFVPTIAIYQSRMVEEGISRGLNAEDAFIYGSGMSLIEGLTESVFPIIGKYGSKAIPKARFMDAVKEGVEKFSGMNAKAALGEMKLWDNIWDAGGYILKAGGLEGVEEIMSEVGGFGYSKLLRNAGINMKDNQKFPSYQQIETSFVIGATVGLLGGGITSIRREQDHRNVENGIYKSMKNIDKFKEYVENNMEDYDQLTYDAIVEAAEEADFMMNDENVPEGFKLKYANNIFDQKMLENDDSITKKGEKRLRNLKTTQKLLDAQHKSGDYDGRKMNDLIKGVNTDLEAIKPKLTDEQKIWLEEERAKLEEKYKDLDGDNENLQEFKNTLIDTELTLKVLSNKDLYDKYAKSSTDFMSGESEGKSAAIKILNKRLKGLKSLYNNHKHQQLLNEYKQQAYKGTEFSDASLEEVGLSQDEMADVHSEYIRGVEERAAEQKKKAREKKQKKARKRTKKNQKDLKDLNLKEGSIVKYKGQDFTLGKLNEETGDVQLFKINSDKPPIQLENADGIEKSSTSLSDVFEGKTVKTDSQKSSKLEKELKNESKEESQQRRMREMAKVLSDEELGKIMQMEKESKTPSEIEKYAKEKTREKEGGRKIINKHEAEKILANENSNAKQKAAAEYVIQNPDINLQTAARLTQEAIETVEGDSEASNNNQKAIYNLYKKYDKPSSEMEVGDYAQWNHKGNDQFDEPRRIESVEEGENGQMVKFEGKTEPVPANEVELKENYTPENKDQVYRKDRKVIINSGKHEGKEGKIDKLWGKDRVEIITSDGENIRPRLNEVDFVEEKSENSNKNKNIEDINIGDLISEGFKLMNIKFYGVNKLAYLVRDYFKNFEYGNRNEVLIKDVNNILKEEGVEIMKIKKGNNIGVEITEDEDQVMTDPITGDETTFKEFKEKYFSDGDVLSIRVRGGKIIRVKQSKDSIDLSINDFKPIKLDGYKAFIHLPTWFNSNNVQTKNKEYISDQAYEDMIMEMSDLRTKMLEMENPSIEVIGRKPGAILRTVNNEFFDLNTYKNYNPEINIAVNGHSFKSKLKKDTEQDLIPGVLYLSTKMGTKTMHIPLKFKQAENIDQEHRGKILNTVLQVLKFANTKNESKLSPEERKLKKDFEEEANINFNDSKQVNNYINQFFFTSSNGEKYKKNSVYVTEDGKIKMSKDGSTPTINREELTNNEKLKVLKKYLISSLTNINVNKYTDEKNIQVIEENQVKTVNYATLAKAMISSNVIPINIGTESNPDYVHTAQNPIMYKVTEGAETQTKTKDHMKQVEQEVAAERAEEKRKQQERKKKSETDTKKEISGLGSKSKTSKISKSDHNSETNRKNCK